MTNNNNSQPINNGQSIRFIPIDTLSFDPKNPRLPATVDGHDEQSVLTWMLEDATIIELMWSIGEKGYFPGEPLLVISDSKNPQRYIVIEGNRRLTAAKLLSYPDTAPIRKKAVEQASNEAKHKPEELPTLVFNKREDILNYLGYRHITGIKPWGSLAKTKYLKQLLDTLGEGNIEDHYKTLAKIIGSRADYVARMLTGLAVYEKIVDNDFFGIKSLNEDSIDFSILTTALSYQNITHFLGMGSSRDQQLSKLNNKHLKELVEWLFERNDQGRTRLGESRRLSDLNAIVGTEKALEAFRSGQPLNNAILLTEAPNEIFRKAIMDARLKLETARDSIHLVNNVSVSDSELLLEIQKLARSLRAVLDDKLADAIDL